MEPRNRKEEEVTLFEETDPQDAEIFTTTNGDFFSKFFKPFTNDIASVSKQVVKEMNDVLELTTIQSTHVTQPKDTFETPVFN
ncbi:hypothetical protein Tco_0221629 [Tanacetum coccineum]